LKRGGGVGMGNNPNEWVIAKSVECGFCFIKYSDEKPIQPVDRIQ
jgi:hypothetical protein